MLFGRTQSQASFLCSAPAACRWPGPGPGMLCGVIPAQKRASGCQRATETGRVRVLLSFGTTHKRIADLVSVRPRSLCSSPTGCAKHQSHEKVVLPACLPAGTGERLETARHFAQTWSCEGFLCCWRGVSSRLHEASGGEGALVGWGCRSSPAWRAGAPRGSALTSAEML